jgi:hypothetical protein
MKLWSKRLLPAAAGVAVVWLSGAVLTRQAAAQAGQAVPAKGQSAGEVFKNVTTTSLKGLTVDDFMGAMGAMTAALGFDCSDCHTGAGTDNVNWVVDTQRKITGRKMIDMVAAINKNNFAGVQEVTCWTCHHGREHPATTIALDHLYGEPNDEKDDIIQVGQGQPSATQILDKYIAALGGAQKLASVTSWVATGTQGGYARVRGGGKFQIFAKSPDERTVAITFPDAPDRGGQTRAYDGKAGWVNTPRSILGEYQVTGSELDTLRVDALMAFPAQIKTAFTNLRVGFPDTLNGKEVDVVQGRGPRGLLTTMYFDKQTGLLVRVVRYGNSTVGRYPTQSDFGDYRDVNGIKFPFTYQFSWLDGRDQFTISDYKVNVPIDAKVFGRPAAGTKN